MPNHLIQNSARPDFTSRVTEVALPGESSSRLSVNQINNSHQQPHSFNELKRDAQDTGIYSSKKTAQSESICVHEEFKDAMDNCIGILAERKDETATFPFVDKTTEGISDSFCYMLSDKQFFEKDFLKILQYIAKEDISITQILPKNIQDMIGKIENVQYLKMTSAMKKLADKARQSENQMEKDGISNLLFDLKDLGNSKTSLGVSQWFPEGLLLDLSNSMIKKVNKTQNDIDELSRLFKNKKPEPLQQPSLPYYSDSRNKQTNRLLNSLSLTSPTLYNVIPLNAALTNEQKKIINQQVKNYVALNNSKASYEVLYENPTDGAQGIIEINSVNLDYSPIMLKDNDTLKRRWDIISGFVDMLKKAENEKNIYGYDFANYEYLTLDMLEENTESHHVKVSLPAHIEQILVNENEQGNIFDYRLSHRKSWTYLTPEVKKGKPHRPNSVSYSASVIIAQILGFDFNKNYTNIPLGKNFSKILGGMQNNRYKYRVSLGEFIEKFTTLHDKMKYEIDCERSGQRTDFFAQLRFENVSEFR